MCRWGEGSFSGLVWIVTRHSGGNGVRRCWVHVVGAVLCLCIMVPHFQYSYNLLCHCDFSIAITRDFNVARVM